MAKKSTGAIATRSGQDDWQTESDLRTLIEAEKIEKDPKRLAAAQKMARDKVMDFAAVASEAEKC